MTTYYQFDEDIRKVLETCIEIVENSGGLIEVNITTSCAFIIDILVASM